MNRFGMVFEDPTYDEDGNCVDEDFEWEDAKELQDQLDNYDPYDTVNS